MGPSRIRKKTVAYNTKRWRPSDALTTDEVMFLIDLYARASGDADNVALISDIGGSVATVDISAQFNGSSTSFTVPANAGILLFIITGWPPNGALRPTVDFTTPDATHVTLQTSQVQAPVAGTTGIVIYIPA